MRGDAQQEELDEELREAQSASKQASIDMMRAHLTEFKRTNGPEATFKGWIAMLHPENVTLDQRLDRPNNSWLELWNEAQAANEPTRDA